MFLVYQIINLCKEHLLFLKNDFFLNINSNYKYIILNIVVIDNAILCG